jgi:MarR family transcriptional regulator, transcriptional regulator for hemolysin
MYLAASDVDAGRLACPAVRFCALAARSRDSWIIYHRIISWLPIRYAEHVTTPAADRAAPDLSFMLAHAAHVLATRMTAAFAEIGITPREYCVLRHAASGELTQIELARVSDLDKTTMVVTLDELEATGYAERRPSKADRRARVVVVTDEGKRLVEGGHQIADRVHAEVLAQLPLASRTKFVDCLASLVGGPLAEPVASERPVRRARQSAG